MKMAGRKNTVPYTRLPSRLCEGEPQHLRPLNRGRRSSNSNEDFDTLAGLRARPPPRLLLARACIHAQVIASRPSRERVLTEAPPRWVRVRVS